MRKSLIIAGLATTLLAGCVSVEGVDALKTVEVGDGVTVTPQVAWARINLPNNSDIFWTIDGIGLDELHFYMGINSGDSVIKIPGKTKGETGTYSATMLPNDVMDLVATTLEKDGYQAVRGSGLKPVLLEATTGFRFDLAFSTPSGLQMKGSALVIQRTGRIDLLLFIAPSEYYFGHTQPIVEKVFASLQVADQSIAVK